MKSSFFVLLLIFAAVFSAQALAANLTCVVNQSQCQTGFTTVLRMSNGTDSHAELPSVFNYNVSVCCRDSDGVSVLGTTSGTSFLKLSNTTDAHTEQGTLSNYANIAYLSSSSGAVSCTYSDVAGVCAATYACLGTISNTTDAQTANCTAGNAYTSTVCCKLTAAAAEAAASSGSSGGGGGDSGCQAEWECSGWGECTSDGFQYRACNDLNACSERPNVRYITPAEPTQNRTCSFTYEPSCSDGILNDGETGIDCGGSCGACDVGSSCVADNDCLSANCLQGICRSENIDCVLDNDCNEGFVCRYNLCFAEEEAPRTPANVIADGIVNGFKASVNKISDVSSTVFSAVKNALGSYGMFVVAAIAAAALLLGGYFGYKSYIGSEMHGRMLARSAARRTEAAEERVKMENDKREADARERAKALVMYIRSAAMKGYGAKEIGKLLVSHGWPADRVDSYIKYVFKNYAKEVTALKEEGAVKNYDEEMQDIDQRLKEL